MLPAEDVFESRPVRDRRRRWADLPPRWRWSAVAVVLVLLVGAVVGVVLDRRAQHRDAERVAVSVALAVAVSSASPPGGAVNYGLLVRNEGRAPVVITSVAGGSERLVLRSLGGDRRVPPGVEVQLQTSVRLVCGGVTGRPPAGLHAEVRVRRTDGSTAVRQVAVGDAGSLLDVATTVCAVRPELRDFELNGPVARSMSP